jgi:hypothetical protein
MINVSKKFTYPALLTLTVILLLGVTTIFLNNFLQLKRGGYFRMRPPRTHIDTVELIQSWMTFEYINHSFGLPVDYLQNELHSTSKKYPKITIKNFAQERGESPTALLQRIRISIETYKKNQK